MPTLLDKRLIFVMGKGGVGRSTVATALGLLSARHGLRTIVAELASQDRVQQAFEQGGAQFREVELAPKLYTISIDPQQAMDEYLRIKTGTLGQALGSTKLFQAFATATPGMRELLTMGKIWELAQFERHTRGAATYDVVIVDSPATGHGIGILRAPRTFAEIARVGPISRQAGKIAATIADSSFTGVLGISTPEEMPINEVLGLRDALARDELPLDAVIVNSLYPERFDEREASELAAALPRADSGLVRGALRAALSEHARAARQREQLARLVEELGPRVIELPYLFVDHLERPELERLADGLERGLLEVERTAFAAAQTGSGG